MFCASGGNHAVNGRTQITSEWKKGKLGDAQAIIGLQAGDQFFVREVGFLKHGAFFLWASKQVGWATVAYTSFHSIRFGGICELSND